MQTLLKNSVTGLYYQGVADWTERLDLAFDFQKPERLVRFVRQADLNLEHLELVFAFDDPRYNLALPIDERFGVKRAVSKRKGSQRLALLGAVPKRPLRPLTGKELPSGPHTCARGLLSPRL